MVDVMMAASSMCATGIASGWTNPHVWVTILVTDHVTGETVLWPVEASSTATLLRMGWKRDSLRPGDKARLMIHPLPRGNVGGSLVSAVSNGKEVGHPMRT
jgi:hypothetical protein